MTSPLNGSLLHLPHRVHVARSHSPDASTARSSARARPRRSCPRPSAPAPATGRSCCDIARRPRNSTTRSLDVSRSAGTLPKYASLTTGPSVDSGPASNGNAIVVCGVGSNWPRIQIETSPDPCVHGFGAGVGDGVRRFEGHRCARRPGVVPSCLAISSADEQAHRPVHVDGQRRAGVVHERHRAC